MTPEQLRRMEDYLRQVREVVHGCSQELNEYELAEAEHLIAHGEPAEGLRTLAWIISEKKVRVPARTIRAIRELTEGLLDPSHLPQDLDQYGTE